MRIYKSQNGCRFGCGEAGWIGVCFWGAVFILVSLSGCDEGPGPLSAERITGRGFSVASVHFTGLTRLVPGGSDADSRSIRTFVELRDVYDSKLKSPAVFRFDLYRYVPHRSDPRGTHLQTWPDFRLTEAPANHLYWRDYLRAYEFSLEIDPSLPAEETYLLEVTCLTDEPKRMCVFYVLQGK